jgi:hypothetical protein
MALNPFDEALDQTEPTTVATPPARDAYDAALDRMDQASTLAMRRTLTQTSTESPEQAAEARRLSLRFGVPPTEIGRNLDVYRQRAAVEHPVDQIQQQSPHLAFWLEGESNAAVAHDDLEPLGALEWLMTAPRRAWDRGIAQVQFGQLSNASIFRDLTADERQRLEQLRQQMEQGGALGAGESWFRKAVTGAAGQLPITFGAAIAGARYGIPAGVTAGTGAALLGQVGPQIATPEEILTVPAAFAGGMTAGVITGGAAFGFQLESGLAFDEYSKLKDELGQPLDPDVARAAALATGALNGGLEVIGLGALARSIPGLDKLTKPLTRGAVRQALLNPSIRGALFQAVKSYAGTLTAETAVEVAQRSVTILSGELAKVADGSSIPLRSPSDVANDLKDEAIGALLSFSLLSAPGPSVRLTQDVQQARRAAQNVAFFQALGEGVTNSKATQRAPEAVQALLQQAGEVGGVPNVYAPVETWTTYWQSQGVDPAEMAAAVTGNSNALEEAQATGIDLAIPTARYATSLAGTTHNAFFAQELRLAPDEMNAREAQAFQQEQAAIAQEQAAAERVPTAREQIRVQLTEQLEAAAVPRQTAESYAALVEAGVGTLAEAAGLDAMQVFERYGLQIERTTEAEASGTAATPVETTGPAEANIASAAPENAPLELAAEPRAQRLGSGAREQRVVFDREGTRRVLTGPEAVDYRPQRGETLGIEAAGGFRVIEDRGGAYTPEQQSHATAESGIAPGSILSDRARELAAAHAERGVEGAGDGGVVEPRRLPSPIDYASEGAFERATPEADQARLTPEVTRELSRIADELREFPFIEKTWSWIAAESAEVGNAAGGKANVVGGAPGAPVYNDVLTFAPLNKGRGMSLATQVRGSRAQVEQAIRKALESGTIHNNLAEGAVRVAERREAGDYRHIGRPLMPPSWGVVASEAFTDALSEAIDAELVAGALETDEQQETVETDEGDTSFDVTEFGQGLFDALEDALAGEAVDVLETGEVQPRLPGAEQVREQEIATPEFEAPFALTPPKGETGRRGKQATLFQRRRGAITFGSDRHFTIRLFENADLSTFLHESGHFFLEVFSDLVEQIPIEGRTAQQAQLATDYAALLEALGAETRQQIGTEQHEQFARMFEAYLFEGKAPSLELRSIFAKFRAWLLGVYRHMRALRAPLTAEVRGVFDRMLAGEQAIRQAEDSGRFDPMFLTPEAAGMTPERFELYRVAIEDASRTAREDLDRKLAAEVQRERERAWKARRVEMRTDVEQAAHQAPVYRALAAIRRGTNPDGSVLVEGIDTPPLRLSRAIVVERFGIERLKTLPPFTYSREGGLDPDVLATQFGFGSGDELLTAISTAQPMEQAIDAETDRRMLVEHGSMLLDGTLPAEAQASTANEVREGVVRAELRALWDLQQTAAPFVAQARREEQAERDYERRWLEAEAKLRIAIAEGRKQVEIDRLEQQVQELKARARGGAAEVRSLSRGIPSQSAIRDAARTRIQATRIIDLEPARFWAASRRAAQQALERSARQDFAGAVQAKTQELINLALYRESERAKEDVENRVRKARDLAKPKTQARIGLAGGPYLDQILGVLERYEFARVSRTVLERRANVRDFVAGLEGEGLPVDLPDEVLNDARRINYQQITVAELEGVSDGLDQIVHLARLKNRLLKTQAKRTLDDEAARLAESIRANARSRRRAPRRDRPPSEESRRTVADFFGGHRKLASLLREMDGFQDGGPMVEAIMFRLNDAAARESEMMADATKRFAELVERAFPGREKRTLYTRRMVPAVGRAMSRMERIMVAMNWGNEGNRDRIRLAEGWTDAQAQAVLDTLSAADLQFVQGVFDLFESFRPAIGDKQKRVYGIEPTWVEAVPIHAANGDIRGGYFPLRYDDRLSAGAIAKLDLEAANLARNAAYTQATTKRGHTKERAQRVKMPVRLDFGTMFEHVDQVIHDLTHHETLIDVGRILGHKDVQTAILETRGDIVYKQIRGTIRDIAFGDVPAVNGFERALNHVRAGATVAGLGWNLTTAALQPLGLTNSIVRVGPTWIARGVVRWLRSPQAMTETVGWIEDRSAFMRARGRSFNREINEIRNRVGVETSSLSGWIDEALSTITADHVTRQGVADSYFWMIQQMQRVADVPTWLGEYEKATAAGDTETRAIARADQAVLDSQGGGQIKDLAQVQRGGPMMRLWTNFYSFFNVLYNQAVESQRRTHYRNPVEVGRLAADYMMLFIVPATLGYLVREGLRPGSDEDDDIATKIAWENASYVAGTMLGLREVSGALTGAFGYEGPAGARAFASLARLGQQARQGEADAAFWRALNDVGGVLLHYPAGQVKRTIEGIAALAEGKTQNPGAVMTGAPRK